MLLILPGKIWAQKPSLSAVELGKRIYTDGLLSNGDSILGVTRENIPFSGSQLSCINCHRRSGYGSSEGGVYVLPITGPLLFQKRQLDRAFIYKKLFKETQDKRFWSRMRSPRMRPAYTEKTFATLLRTGIDPAGRKLNSFMPRFDLKDDEIANLLAYLKTLSANWDPGVDNSNLYIASIVTETSSPEKRKSMESVIEKFVKFINVDAKGDTRHANFSINYRTDLIQAYRYWRHEFWELRGAPDSWKEQLEVYYSRRPVFAVVSGMFDSSAKSMQEFCEKKRLPCLFPHTEMPVTDRNQTYTVYLHAGLSLEAEVLGQYLRKTVSPFPGRVIQLHDASVEGSIPAKIVEKYLNRSKFPATNRYKFNGANELKDRLGEIATIDAYESVLVVWPGNNQQLV
ncbi:hypothetical protein ACFL17_01860 [Pseudomonadota bacterium]